MLRRYLIATLTLVAIARSDNIGWKGYFVESPQEFHDIPLVWESGNTTVPSWLTGIFVKNGPAQHTFGSPKKHLSSWLDGFAKLHSFKFDGSNVYFSGKMVESTTYMDSVAAGELVPQVTLNKLANPDEEWTALEIGDILYRQMTQWYGDLSSNAYDNNNPAVWRMGSKEDPIYMVTTDFPYPQRFDINTLESLEIFRPADAPSTKSGCAHWQREPNTDNSIYMMLKAGGILSNDYVEVQRFTPDNRDYAKPEVVATFTPHKNSAVHSFQVTESYAIFLYPALTYDTSLGCLIPNGFHALECMIYLEDEPTDIFVVNLKTGEVQEIQADVHFFQHHVNAYEVEGGREIILDLSPADPYGLREYVKFENMLNPPEVSNGTTPSGGAELTRLHIYLDSGSVVTSGFPNLIEDSRITRYVNQFDFPVINEAYRGKEYCVIYGWSAFDYSRTALVKKNICDATQDKVIYIENHYTSEMFFIANPEGTAEDDGVLVSVVFDGPKNQSYFLVMDAATFTEIDRSYLPHNIPWVAHGMHFPEAKWTLSN